jgi:hypothetical protein
MMQKEAAMACFRVISWNLYEVTEENMKILKGEIATLQLSYSCN